MADSDVIERARQIDADVRYTEQLGNDPKDAEPRTVMVPFDLLWLQVSYRRWPQDDHWQDALVGQIDIYADRNAAKLLGEDLTLDSFTPDQASIIAQNLDIVLTRARWTR